MRRTSSPPRAVDERGDTLIELLIAVVIISFAFAALLGALITAITASGEHRFLAVDDTIVKSYADTAKSQIEQAQTVPFVPCATSYPVVYTPPSRYLISTTIAYWNGSTYVGGCTNSKPDKGMQLVTVTATAPNGVQQSLAFVLRDPSYES